MKKNYVIYNLAQEGFFIYVKNNGIGYRFQSIDFGCHVFTTEEEAQEIIDILRLNYCIVIPKFE